MNTLLQALVSGLSIGSTYALVALGFSVVYRGSRVINFAQGAMVLAGAYLVSWLALDHGVPFIAAIVLAIAVVATGGMLFDATILRRLTAKDINSSVIITLALSIGLAAVIEICFGTTQRELGDPWGADTVSVGAVSLPASRVWGIGISILVAAAFVLLDRGTRFGLAMRASASDEEAALAVGVPVWRVRSLTWAIAGVLAVIGGVFLTAYPSSVTPTVSSAALAAFPALILGGLDSPSGALLGGVVIGIVQVLAGTYQPTWLGDNFDTVAPYAVMIVILLVRPYGLLGTRPAERI